MGHVSFECSDADRKVICKIAERASRLYLKFNEPDKFCNLQSMDMDITAVHCNGCPLRLEDLLAADDFNFMHDVYKIIVFLDRSTGKLMYDFRPRFAQKKDDK
jgi:hypothetical protein